MQFWFYTFVFLVESHVWIESFISPPVDPLPQLQKEIIHVFFSS